MSDDKKDELPQLPPYFPLVEDGSAIIGSHLARQRHRAHATALSSTTGMFGPLSAVGSVASITVLSHIIPERITSEGILVRSTTAVWLEIVQKLGSDWTHSCS
jgi:hypothetical protein